MDAKFYNLFQFKRAFDNEIFILQLKTEKIVQSLMSAGTRLRKLVHILENQGYAVRYEKGQFESGACIVQDRKVIIVNKFLSDESKLEVLQQISRENNITRLAESGLEEGK